jgi:hypothetical protein
MHSINILYAHLSQPFNSSIDVINKIQYIKQYECVLDHFARVNY